MACFRGWPGAFAFFEGAAGSGREFRAYDPGPFPNAMIEAPRPPFSAIEPRITILAIGSAGGHALDRIVLDHAPPGVELIAVNTDSQALTGSVAPHKLQIGDTIARGFGAGGDPETGRAAVEESIGEIQRAVERATVVFLLAGLGGGTGSGGAPLIAELAREANALVVAFVTLPFAFEGRRRVAQAEAALTALRESADIVICFENDRMANTVSPKAPIPEAFAAADRTLSQSVRALVAVALRRGLLHAGFDEVASALRGDNVRCVFGHGAAAGDNRANEALALALKNPLLDRARLKGEVEAVVATIAGGPDLTLNEVQMLLEELNRHLHEHARVFFGVATDAALAGTLTVTILGGFACAAMEPEVAPEPEAPVRRENTRKTLPDDARRHSPRVEDAHASEDANGESDELQEVAPTESESPSAADADLADAAHEPVPPSRSPDAAPRPVVRPRSGRVEQMQLEPINRGRFEKSEPTIVDGEDLDVPTFLRRNPKRK